MHVADFCGSDGSDSRGKFQQVREKLDYLCDLGINAIELMPVNEYPGDYSWGYKVRDFFAVESSYGETADLKQLIDECHGRGIRMIQEGIYNHCDEDCPLLLIDRNYWYYRDKHYPEDPANYWGRSLTTKTSTQNWAFVPLGNSSAMSLISGFKNIRSTGLARMLSGSWTIEISYTG